ncbi:hypothetical protein BDA99DRAFT_532830 [Phascolomyces articulosus]|uniref:Uncharacterized protein n=1 Tax=Phascolomyces articulosus TaxID=60185 RepID=A0AAD5K9W7_9FUNG|nr:hypothetical protein BDA99DRAFT_532830 [Phascolomyces articulosus]
MYIINDIPPFITVLVIFKTVIIVVDQLLGVSPVSLLLLSNHQFNSKSLGIKILTIVVYKLSQVLVSHKGTIQPDIVQFLNLRKWYLYDICLNPVRELNSRKCFNQAFQYDTFEFGHCFDRLLLSIIFTPDSKISEETEILRLQNISTFVEKGYKKVYISTCCWCKKDNIMFKTSPRRCNLLISYNFFE